MDKQHRRAYPSTRGRSGDQAARSRSELVRPGDQAARSWSERDRPGDATAPRASEPDRSIDPTARRSSERELPGRPGPPRRPFVLLLAAVLLLLPLFPTGSQAQSPSDFETFSFGLHVREPTGVLPFHAVWAAETGAQVVPVSFAWDEAEPSPGRFALERQRALVSALKVRGLRVVGVLDYPSGLPLATAPSSRSGWPTGHVDDWTFFVTQIVSRFRDDVDAWVIDGLPRQDSGNLFQAAEAERYAAFVRITAGALRRHEPRKPLLAVAPGTDVVWLQLFDRFGGLSAVDGLAVDVNRWPTPPSGLGVALRQLREGIRARGETMTVWVWDFGYPTHSGVSVSDPRRRGVTEEQQAVYLVQSHAALLAAGADAVFYAELFDRGPSSDDAGHNFGLMRWDMSRKPAFGAYEAMTNFLRDLRLARAGDVIRRPELPGRRPEVKPEAKPDAEENENGEGDGEPRFVPDMTPAPDFDPVPDGVSRGATEPATTTSATVRALGQDSSRAAPDVSIGGRTSDTDSRNTDSYASAADSSNYHFVFDDEMLRITAGEEVVAHVFTGEAGTVIVVWSEPALPGGGCRDGCGHANVLQWLDGAPVRAYDMFGAPIWDQSEWQPGRGPVYLELPLEMVP